MFVSVKFQPDDKRAYTYTWDGEPLSPGDMVEVETFEGSKIVTVDSVDVPAPSFDCKPIIGRAEAAADIGHNSGEMVPLTDDPIDAICAAYEGTRMEGEHWLDGTSTVTDEATMKAVDRVRKEARQWRLELERGQKEATAPLYDAYKAEGARWKPTIDDAKRIEAGLVSLGNGYKQQLKAEKEAIARKAWQEAEAKRREVEAAAMAAKADDLDAQRAVAQMADDAAQAMQQASAASKDKVRGLRKVWKHEIKDYAAELNWIIKNDRDAMTAFLDDYARRNHRTMPPESGVRVWHVEEAF